jgi:hypothetical protein
MAATGFTRASALTRHLRPARRLVHAAATIPDLGPGAL